MAISITCIMNCASITAPVAAYLRRIKCQIDEKSKSSHRNNVESDGPVERIWYDFHCENVREIKSKNCIGKVVVRSWLLRVHARVSLTGKTSTSCHLFRDTSFLSWYFAGSSIIEFMISNRIRFSFTTLSISQFLMCGVSDVRSPCVSIHLFTDTPKSLWMNSKFLLCT